MHAIEILIWASFFAAAMGAFAARAPVMPLVLLLLFWAGLAFRLHFVASRYACIFSLTIGLAIGILDAMPPTNKVSAIRWVVGALALGLLAGAFVWLITGWLSDAVRHISALIRRRRTRDATDV